MYNMDTVSNYPAGMDASWVMMQYHKQQMMSANDNTDASVTKGVMANPYFNKFKSGANSVNTAGTRQNPRPKGDGSFDGGNPMRAVEKKGEETQASKPDNKREEVDLYDVYDT